MSGRTIAVGDVHGCSAALGALLDAVRPAPPDTLVFLGDYIDRGPDSRGVLDQLVALADCCRLVPLLGNHEEMLVNAVRDPSALRPWLSCGGVETLRSYGWGPGAPRRGLADWIDDAHWAFLASCLTCHETDRHLFVHAGYVPALPLARQPGEALRWRVTDPGTARPHVSGKVAVVGHTPQRSGEILDEMDFSQSSSTNFSERVFAQARSGSLSHSVDVQCISSWSTGITWRGEMAGSANND